MTTTRLCHNKRTYLTVKVKLHVFIRRGFCFSSIFGYISFLHIRFVDVLSTIFDKPSRKCDAFYSRNLSALGENFFVVKKERLDGHSLRILWLKWLYEKSSCSCII